MSDMFDELAYRFWSIHPRDIPEPVNMPEGYKGGKRAWFYANEMRRIAALSELNANLAAQVAELTADRDKWFEGAGAHHVASMKQAQRADIAEAKVARLEGALRDIAAQKKTDELDTEYDVECADFEGGYDAIIDVARAALTEGTPE